MNKKILICILCVALLLTLTLIFIPKKKELNVQKIEATVLYKDDNLIKFQDNDNVIYTFNENVDLQIGDYVILEYTGLLDKNKEIQDGKIINYEVMTVNTDEDKIPSDFKDNGIFSTYYVMAYNKLKELSLDEKIGQLLLGRYPTDKAVDDLKKYHLSGFVLFEKDFRNKTKDEVISMIKNLQDNSKIPLLTAVDEEGGTVVRVSSNPKLIDSPFKSPKQLYDDGQFDLIKSDTIKKSEFLNSLGLNVNLAPVVDVTTNPSDYMYNRALGENTYLTSEFAKTVISASKNTGVSYTLKHFPGYGSNLDTHTGSSTDSRSLEDIKTKDLPPFEAGINAGAEAVLVSHNIVTSIDKSTPASLSASVHNLLRNELNFTGIIMTDDLDMGATKDIENKSVKALLAGNNLLITTDYAKSVSEIKSALQNGTISENQIDKLAFKVLAWKYYKGLMMDLK